MPLIAALHDEASSLLPQGQSFSFRFHLHVFMLQTSDTQVASGEHSVALR